MSKVTNTKKEDAFVHRTKVSSWQPIKKNFKKTLLQQKHFRKISFPQLILQQCSVQVYKSPSVPDRDLGGLFNHRHVHSCS